MKDNNNDNNIENNNGFTKFMNAIFHGNFHELESLVISGSKINSSNFFDIDKKNLDGHSAFFWACENNKRALAELLYNNGACINMPNPIGFTPLVCAYKSKNFEFANWLIDHGADMSAKSNVGTSVFTMVCTNGDLEDVKSFVKKYLAKFYIKEEDFDYTNLNYMGFNTLSYVAYSDNPKIIEYLYEKGVDINQVSDNEMTPLLISCSHGQYKNVKTFLKIQQNITNQNMNILLDEALMVASRCGDFKMFKLLIENKADIHSLDKDNDNALINAVSLRPNALDSVKLQKIDILKFLLKGGVNINFTNSMQETPLMIATFCGFFDAVHLLINEGADLNMLNNQGCNVMYFVRNNIDIFELLLEQQIHINRELLLAFFIKLEQVGIVKDQLVEVVVDKLFKGHDWNQVVNERNDTYLHLVIKSCNVNLSTILIKNGASILQKNLDNISPIDVIFKEIITIISQNNGSKELLKMFQLLRDNSICHEILENNIKIDFAASLKLLSIKDKKIGKLIDLLKQLNFLQVDLGSEYLFEFLGNNSCSKEQVFVSQIGEIEDENDDSSE